MAKSLEKTLKNVGKGVSAELKASQREEKEEKKADRDYGERETKLFGKKLKLAKEIFAWGEKFQKNKNYASLQRIAEATSGLGSSDELRVYQGGWGHRRITHNGFGQWSWVCLNEDGSLSYTPGYKYFGTKYTQKFFEPKDLAKALSFEYLTGLHEGVCVQKNLANYFLSRLKRNPAYGKWSESETNWSEKDTKLVKKALSGNSKSAPTSLQKYEESLNRSRRV